MSKDFSDSFIYRAHCLDGEPSSKRLWGAIGYGTFQLCILVASILSLVYTLELSETVKDLLEVDLITSASLLGLSTITGVFGNGRKVSVGKNQTDEEESEEETYE